MKITSSVIKTALLSYYRFTRNMSCVDEAYAYVAGETCDILVDSGKAFYDIEIKISKSDLWRGEAKKRKHKVYKDPESYYLKNQRYPNYFIICVPTHLYAEAVKWVEATNKNYGIIEFSEDWFKNILYNRVKPSLENCIWFRKNARKLHNSYFTGLKTALNKRLSSAYVNLRQKDFKLKLDKT